MDSGKEKVAAQTAIWLSRIERGLDAQEVLKLREWLAKSAHREAIVTAAKLWHGPDILAVLAELVPVGFGTPPPPLPKRPRTAALVIGAGLVLFMAATFTLPRLFIKHPIVVVSRYEEIFDTGIGETRPVPLPDGSHLVMNGQTTLYVLSAGSTREATVASGETLFDVARQGPRPFKIFAGGRHFEALAGRFDLKVLSPHSVRLTVLEGDVLAKGLPYQRPDSPTDARSADPGLFADATLGPLQSAVLDSQSLTLHPISAALARAQVSWSPIQPVYVSP